MTMSEPTPLDLEALYLDCCAELRSTNGPLLSKLFDVTEECRALRERNHSLENAKAHCARCDVIDALRTTVAELTRERDEAGRVLGQVICAATLQRGESLADPIEHAAVATTLRLIQERDDAERDEHSAVKSLNAARRREGDITAQAQQFMRERDEARARVAELEKQNLDFAREGLRAINENTAIKLELTAARAVVEACRDWVRDDGTCFFCSFGDDDGPVHDEDCPLLAYDTTRGGHE